MKIGILQFELVIDGSRSLKDKRRVVKSLKDRLHRWHMVSVAEVGALDKWNLAIMGLAAVSADAAYLGSLLDRIEAKLRSLPDARLDDISREIVDPREVGGDDLWRPGERRDPAEEGEAA